MTEVCTRPQNKNKAMATGAASGEEHPQLQPGSPTVLVLSIRPEGEKFNGNRIERAKEAGFVWLKNTQLIGMSCPDTGEEIARHIVNCTDESFGQLKEVQIHIDPEHCAWMWRAGRYLMDRLNKYALLIGGRVCDGLGQPLNDEAKNSIAEHIDSVMARRRDADRKARTVTLPSGEQRELSELSFAYEVVREAGVKKKSYRKVNFDAPALHIYEGRALGKQMAGEIVQFYRKHRTQRLDLGGILREAVQILGPGFGTYYKADAANVASGFLDVIETLIEVGARNLNPEWLKYQIEHSQSAHLDWTKDKEQRRAEFVERMRSGKKAAADRRLKDAKTAQ